MNDRTLASIISYEIHLMREGVRSGRWNLDDTRALLGGYRCELRLLLDALRFAASIRETDRSWPGGWSRSLADHERLLLDDAYAALRLVDEAIAKIDAKLTADRTRAAA